jgi:hypothetical protein
VEGVQGKGMPISHMARLASIALAALVLGLLLSGCGGVQEEEKKGASPVAGTFVGEMLDAGENGAFVALVASGAEEEGAEREVRAYLCDGRQINEWFTGSAISNDLSLASEAGTQLQGALAPRAATGTITLLDGSSFPFEAALASGAAGLYDMVFSADERFKGTSETGGRLEGRLGEEINPDIFRISGTISPAAGEPVEIEAFTRLDTRPGEYRWVVLPDGQAKGGAKKGSGPGFTSTEGDL